MLNDIIKASAERALELQQGDGSMPAGHNGPYHDPETPVRNTAHWLFTFAVLHEKSGEKRWEEAAHKAADYLCSERARPMGATFWARKNPQKDFCNGLIGQAWAIEGLVKAASVLHREDCRNVAHEVYILHPFVEERGVWRRVNVDGSYHTVDDTFNHQLWFGAVGMSLQTQEAVNRGMAFLDRVGVHVELFEDGVICHDSRCAPRCSPCHWQLLSRLKYKRNEERRRTEREALRSKSVGYHAFNLYAFALIKQQSPDHPFWQSEKMRKMLAVLNDEVFRSAMDESEYGYPYNPPGIEAAFALEVFEGSAESARWWIKKHADSTYDRQTGSFLGRNAPDPHTSNARIYEAVRLKSDYEL